MPQTYHTYHDLPLTLNPSDVAAALGISRMSAYKLCHSEGFPSMRIGKRILIPRDRFLTWLESKESMNQNATSQRGE